MDAVDTGIEEACTLFGGVLDADTLHGLPIVAGTVERTQQPGGEVRTGRQFGHPPDAFGRGDGHDARDDRKVDAREAAPVAEVEEIMIIKKELCANIVGSFIHLRLEVVHFEQAVGRVRVTFGKACDANAKPPWVGMFARFIELTDVPNEVGGVGEGVLRPVIVTGTGGGVASEGEDVADPNGGVAFECGGDFLRAMIHTREVGDGRGRGRFLDADDEVVGQFPGRAARAVGDAHERGVAR